MVDTAKVNAKPEVAPATGDFMVGIDISDTSGDGAGAVKRFDVDSFSMKGGANPAFRFCPSPGQATTSIYRVDSVHAASTLPRSAIISSVASDVITLTTSVAELFFYDGHMNGCCYVKITNTTRAETAWVKASNSAGSNDELTVTDAADISAWSATDTITVGNDNGSGGSNPVISIDISPMLQSQFGAVFRQAAVLSKISAYGDGTYSAGAQFSPDGATGSFVGVNTDAAGTGHNEVLVFSCSDLSPISNSNLVYLREQSGGANLGIVSAVILGVYQ